MPAAFSAALITAPSPHTDMSSQLTSASSAATPMGVRFENGLEAPEPNAEQWLAMPALGEPKTRYNVGE